MSEGKIDFKIGTITGWDQVLLGIGFALWTFAFWLAFRDVERDLEPLLWVGVAVTGVIGLICVVSACLDIEELPKKPLENENPHGDAGLASWDEATRALRGDTDWEED